MSNSWIEHIREIAKREQIPYPQALLKAKETYKKKENDSIPPTPRGSPVKKKSALVEALDTDPPKTLRRKNLKN